MRKWIIAVLLICLMAGTSFALQGSNKKPTPKPTPRAGGKPTPRSVPGAKPTPAPSPASVANNFKFTSGVFSIDTLIFLVAAAVVAFLLGLIAGLLALGDKGGDAALRGLEAAILAVLGGLFARMFIAALLTKAANLTGAQVAIGWAFFLFPGVVDTIAKIGVHHVVTTPEFLVRFAMIIGAFSGMMNGLWQIHNWKGLGWLAFPLDVTWGLAGATTSSLVHVVNFAWAKHASETREEAHRYNSGMRFKGKFAFTQGPVMSNLKVGPGAPLFRHERTHVWQNRAFGPLFTLTYLGWMAIWLVPGCIAAIATRDGEAIQSWCYYNNPWETWAYLVGAGPRKGRHPLIWSDLVILGISIPFFIGVLILFIWIFWRVWF